YHSCARMADGTVKCWGANGLGELGDGTTTDRALPTTVPGLAGVAQLALGGQHSCARLDDGTVKCWGGNFSGELGDGTTTAKSKPTAVPGLTGVAKLALGGSAGVSAHSCALMNDGTVKCWGYNGHGQLGDGTLVAKKVPTTVPGLGGVAE